MIYLIGGSPRSGKTILSRKLSAELNIPYISTDYLRLVVMPYFKGKDKDDNFPFEKMFNVCGIDKFFLSYSGKEQLTADLKEAKSTWPGIKSLIDHLLVYKADYIIEGVHLLPSLVSKFKEDKNFKIVLLAKTDKDKILDGLQQNRNSGDWIADNIKDDEVLALAAKSLAEYGKYFINESKKFGVTCINTEEKFVDKIEDVLRYLKK